MSKPRDKWLFVENILLNVRIVFLAVAFLHLLITAVVTLNIDMTEDEDPKIRAYYYLRWKLLTCWLNLMTLAYLTARIATDWQIRQGRGHQSHIKALKHASDVLMTGVLMPTTVFADLSFWYLYLKDQTLIAPVLLFNYLPSWSQHSLHSVSLAVVVIDLLLTPRRRPPSLKNRLTLLSTFVLLYTGVVCFCLWRGEVLYAFLEHMTPLQLVLIFAFALAINCIIFYVQWYVIDLLWKRKVYVECVTIKHK